MKEKYIYPALFNVADDGISITFPDLPGCYPCADTMEEAFKNAKEALQLHLFGMEEDGEEIPTPSSISDISLSEGDVLTMIEAWMPPFRDKMLNKTVNKTVTVPHWLDIMAKKEKINLSRTLQDALKLRLGISNPPIQNNYF